MALLLALQRLAAAAVVIPPHPPNVWGGAAYGAALGHSSHLFAFSGADGPTREGSGSTGLLTPQRCSVTFGTVGKATLELGLTTGNGTLKVASSDTIVVDGDSGASELVLTYTAWDTLVGYAPKATLADTEPAQATNAACNITGGWAKGAASSTGALAEYDIVEAMDGTFTATAPGASSWHKASGTVGVDGSLAIVFGTPTCTPFKDHAPALTPPCNEIKWTQHPHPWHRVGGPPAPAPPHGCTTVGGSMTICHGTSGVFAVAYGEGTSGVTASAALKKYATPDAVDTVASARLQPLGKLPPPKMLTANSSLDYALLSAKAYSVMRVNTLAPEGTCKTHWSTPDKVPHQAMWLWDSCYHAIGRKVTHPELAWEFLASMLVNAAADGHVPSKYTSITFHITTSRVASERECMWLQSKPSRGTVRPL